MTIVQFNRDELVLPPKAVAEFLRNLDRNEEPTHERRESERQTAVLEVAVVPVDFELRQCGESFLALSKDISSTGMAIIHTRALASGSVVVELLNRDNSTMQLLAYVVRCVPIRRFYEIGLRFVTRLAGN
jgi:c-di-GMP-binding flagellar brake protein YcgR